MGIFKLHPSLWFFSGAFLLYLLPHKGRGILRLLVPIFAFLSLLHPWEWEGIGARIFGLELSFGQVDKLSLVFGYVFIIIAFGGFLYSLHVKEKGEHFWAMFYAGSALGVVFAGDLLSLYLFWELMAISAVFIIWSNKTPEALKAGYRYLLVHLFGGALLLSGILLYFHETGNLTFSGAFEKTGLGRNLILISFMLNAAVPPLHAWLPDAYPEASPTGAIYLTAYTTKSAVYVLLRAFPGETVLTWFGAIMALYGVVWAIIQNDIRRLLSYHIVSQVGYMVAGVGIGTSLSMSGSVAHAFTHILYKALLFMGTGSVIYATGKRLMTELEGRGLFKLLPWAFFPYMVGAFSISSVPLFSGFISKPMIVEACKEEGHLIPYLLLHLASIGTWLCTAFKLPYYTWFGNKKEVPISVSPLPLSMKAGMVFLSFLCILFGLWPSLLYRLLPYPFEFSPYEKKHLIESLQLLSSSALSVWLLIRYLAPSDKIALDSDWFYRKGALVFFNFCGVIYGLRTALQEKMKDVVSFFELLSLNPFELKRVKQGKPIFPYNPNRYRSPVGMGILIFTIVFSITVVLLII